MNGELRRSIRARARQFMREPGLKWLEAEARRLGRNPKYSFSAGLGG
jgi:hypothetical protein